MLEALFGGIASFVVRVLPTAVGSAFRTVLTALKKVSTPSWLPPQLAASIDSIIDVIKEIDNEISDRERYASRAGHATRGGNSQISELETQKLEQYRKLEEAKKQQSTQQLENQPDKFTETLLSHDKTHLLQYHLGLAVLEKRCKCGYPMRLQHQTINDPSFSHFFWQCTRYYVEDSIPNCKNINFRASDIKLLHVADIPELQISKDDLQVIGKEKTIQADTSKRLSDHLHSEDREVLCPVHMTPMVLLEKKGDRIPLLDRYHLRCSHFQCSQITKLKSIPQLAAFLRRKEGTGIVF